MNEQPIFIIGPGRSGTTLLLQLMALHPDLAWFSAWTDRYPRRLWLAAFSRLNDIPLIERASRQWSIWPHPIETHGIWDDCFPGFSHARVNWNQSHATAEGTTKFQRVVAAHQRWQGKSGFLTKYTGWPRIDFVREIYPDARFLHIDRQPSSVVYSMMGRHWWLAETPETYNAMSLHKRLTFYAEKYMDLYRAKCQYQAPNDYFSVSYDALVYDPEPVLQTVCDYLNLPYPEPFARRIAAWPIQRDTNTGWRSLPREEQAYLTDLLREPIEEMGYRA